MAELNLLRSRTIEKRGRAASVVRDDLANTVETRRDNLPQAPRLEVLGDIRPRAWRRGALGSDRGSQ